MHTITLGENSVQHEGLPEGILVQEGDVEELGLQGLINFPSGGNIFVLRPAAFQYVGSTPMPSTIITERLRSVPRGQHRLR